MSRHGRGQGEPSEDRRWSRRPGIWSRRSRVRVRGIGPYDRSRGPPARSLAAKATLFPLAAGLGILGRVENRPTHVLLAENLGRIAEQRGITVPEIADVAGLDRRELLAVLAGQYDADLDWLNEIADALEVDIWELVVDLERAPVTKN